MKKNKKTVGIFVLIALVIGIGFSYVLTSTSEMQEEKKELFAHWTLNMQSEYSDWTYSLSNALASGSPVETLSYLEEVERAESNGWLDDSILEIAGLETGPNGYSTQSQPSYEYIRYLIATWDNDGLSEQEREIVAAIREHANISEEAYEKIRDSTLAENEQNYLEKTEEIMANLQKEMNSLNEMIQKNEEFSTYMADYHGSSSPNEPLFEDESVLESDQLKEKAKKEGQKVLNKELTIEGTSVGTGHLYRDSGAGEAHTFTANEGKYNITISSHGGHLLGMRTSSSDVYPISELEETALRKVRAAEIPGDNWKVDTRYFEDTALISIFQTRDGVELRNYAVEADFDKREDGEYAMTGLDFSFAYKDKSLQDTSATVSPEKAKEALSSSLTIEGAPSLAQIEDSNEEGRLVYIFNISGWDKFSKVLVDATSGKFMEIR